MSGDLKRELEDWLYVEAEVLDAHDYERWLAMLAEDVEYVVPVAWVGGSSTASEMYAQKDDRVSLTLRVDRLKTGMAWAEDPPSRTRHLVTNVRVSATEDPGTVRVKSNVLLVRNRDQDFRSEVLSGAREDLWRRSDRAWLLARRVIRVDQAVLGARNLAIYF